MCGVCCRKYIIWIHTTYFVNDQLFEGNTAIILDPEVAAYKSIFHERI